MSEQPYLSLIVPAYNEAGRIRSTLEEYRKYLSHESYSYEIIVSADGDDGTREIVAQMAKADRRLSVMGSEQRGGKGRGVRLAVAKARGEVIGFADADNKTPICELDRVLPWLGKYDLVIGSRAQHDSVVEKKQKWYRQVGSKGFWVLMQLVVGLPGIRDTQCGFKFFRGDVARDLFSRQKIDGYIFDVEILYLAHQSHYRIKEVGVRWRDDGDSRLDLLSGNLRNALDVLRIRFDRSRPQPAPKKAVLPYRVYQMARSSEQRRLNRAA
jgi:dolichyl-phosphate beta-glucosyltransferase